MHLCSNHVMLACSSDLQFVFFLVMNFFFFPLHAFLRKWMRSQTKISLG